MKKFVILRDVIREITNDTRVQISPPDSPPYNYICQLGLTDSPAPATGWLYENIDYPDHLLLVTAAHCLCDMNDDRAASVLASNISVNLATDTIKKEHTLIINNSNHIYVPYVNFLKKGGVDMNDYGAILLRKSQLPTGNGSPWNQKFWVNLRSSYSGDNSSYLLKTCGYPGEKEEELWFAGGKTTQEPNGFTSQIPSTPGQSGSPAWSNNKLLPTSWEVAGILTGGLHSERDSYFTPITTKINVDFQMLLSRRNDNNIKNTTSSEVNYLTSRYIDLAEVICPQGKIVAGISFYLKVNRVAPQLWCTNLDGTNGSWVQNPQFNDHNYLVQDNVPYVDTTPLTSPGSNYVVKGFSFIANGNRVAPNVGFATSNNLNQITWVNNKGNNTPNYFGSPYQDTMPVYIRYTNFEIINIGFYKKGNRMAPQVSAKMIN